MSSLRGANDLAKFISKNYSGLIVEIGAGHVPEVALRLIDMGLDVLVTDKEARDLGRVHIKKDDIFSPRRDLYQKASLLYSIRPPFELQLAMGALATLLGADVLIRPLGDEVADLPGFSRRLLNDGKARFYVFKLLKR